MPTLSAFGSAGLTVPSSLAIRQHYTSASQGLSTWSGARRGGIPGCRRSGRGSRVAGAGSRRRGRAGGFRDRFSRAAEREVQGKSRERRRGTDAHARWTRGISGADEGSREKPRSRRNAAERSGSQVSGSRRGRAAVRRRLADGHGEKRGAAGGYGNGVGTELRRFRYGGGFLRRAAGASPRHLGTARDEAAFGVCMRKQTKGVMRNAVDALSRQLDEEAAGTVPEREGGEGAVGRFSRGTGDDLVGGRNEVASGKIQSAQEITETERNERESADFKSRSERASSAGMPFKSSDAGCDLVPGDRKRHRKFRRRRALSGDLRRPTAASSSSASTARLRAPESRFRRSAVTLSFGRESDACRPARSSRILGPSRRRGVCGKRTACAPDQTEVTGTPSRVRRTSRLTCSKLID